MADKKKDILLQIKDLKIEGYSDEKWIEIVHGVDLTLHRGEVMGLIGESGAGKSTIGLAAMGFARDGCRISNGSVEFDGMELTTTSEADRRALRGSRIAYVAQSAAASFNPAHRLIEQHTEAPVYHRLMKRMESEEDAVQLYERLRLPNPDEIGFRYPHQVSGGQLQRAMTAMAMSCRPDLIIFDEPTTALDVTTQIEVLLAIRDIVEQFNTAAIYITHDLAVVAQMADTIKVLLKGNEVEESDTRTMLESPKDDYTKSLWAVRSFQREQKPRPGGDAVPVVSVKNVDAAYGPVVTAAHKAKIEQYIQMGVEEGAELLVDGRGFELQGHEKGFFIGPSLFDRVTPQMRTYQEEIFGPVLQIVRARDLEEAARLPSEHQYGNGVAIFTRNGLAAREFAAKVNVGMVGINVPIPVPVAYHTFGGWKRSAFGDTNQHGPEGVKFFTKIKTVTQRWPTGEVADQAFVIPTMQ